MELNAAQRALIAAWKQADKEAAKTCIVVAYDNAVTINQFGDKQTLRGPSNPMAHDDALRLMTKWRNELDTAGNPSIIVTMV